RFPGQWFQIESGLSYNWHRHYDATTGRYSQADPLGFADGPSLYAYVGGNPIGRMDSSGLWCASSGGMTTCSYPGGPSFRLPTPAGFGDFTGKELLYHNYDVQVPIGNADPNCVLQSIINHPTPGNPSAATLSGTMNNATILGAPNPVTSYLTSDLNTGAQIVVNMTRNDSLLAWGYVARMVSNGMAHTYGEGTNWMQSDLITGPGFQEFMNKRVWADQMRSMVGQCGCGK
ncbi:MAG: RHS repeat-associated core domain-containing protein, partial [Caldilineaceae bacterium]|nr:RHS repeat-associated core domain-containing protein [Caldilineaceae bacterium]